MADVQPTVEIAAPEVVPDVQDELRASAESDPEPTAPNVCVNVLTEDVNRVPLPAQPTFDVVSPGCDYTVLPGLFFLPVTLPLLIVFIWISLPWRILSNLLKA